MTTAHSHFATRRDSPYSQGGISETEMDSSIRGPVLFFFTTAILWLLFATFLSLVTALKLHWPTFLDGMEFLTYGRVQAAAVNALVYGWGSLSAMAIGFWLMTRLSQSIPLHGALIHVAGVFWNIGLVLGIGGIFLGDARGFFLLELPRYSVPVLMLSYAFIGVWAVLAFHARRFRVTYVSQWFLLGAFFWFPWIYSIAQMMLFAAPVRGTLQPLVAAWYAHNVHALWLAPVALATLYYFLPKILGQPFRHYYLAPIGFWMYALMASFGGAAHLSGGPVPAWMSTAGIIAMVLLLAPVSIFAIHFLGILSGNFTKVGSSPVLRFLFVAILSLLAGAFLQGTLSFRNFQETLQFTHMTTAFQMLGAHGFFTMTIFGAAYFLLPRLLGTVWPSSALVKAHFWSAVTGMGMIVLGLALGGWAQGAKMGNPEIAFVEVGQATIPWLVMASFGWMVLLTSHMAFALNVALMACFSRSPSTASGHETLFANPGEMKARAT